MISFADPENFIGMRSTSTPVCTLPGATTIPFTSQRHPNVPPFSSIPLSKGHYTERQLDANQRTGAASAAPAHNSGGDALQLSAVRHDNLLGGLARLAAVALDLLDDIHALHDLAEDDVTLVQPGGLDGADEELRAVRVRSGVGHAQDSRAGVLQRKVLILELVAVDRLASGAVVVGKVAT